MKRKILVIDDDGELCEELAEVLQNESYEVDFAYDGAKGRNLISKNAYDLILLDLIIPRITGIDILRSMKNENSSIKVIVLTGRPLPAKSSRTQRHRGTGEDKILQKADGIINKPFDVTKLLKMIKTLIG
jgi:DNA-binding response OmpR family regulator